MRLIDADALIEKYYKQMDELMESTSEHLSAEALSLLCGFTLINSAPTIELKQGEWLFKEITDDYHVTGQCSVCKERRRIDNFCPNCSAKMEGVDNE